MEYDSAGTTYTFESSNMCEIYAHQNGQPVFVSNSVQPEINLMSFTESPKHNLYYLDTTSGSWINRGKDEIVVVGDSDVDQNTAEENANAENQNVPEPPVKPIEASGDKALFDIAIEPGSTEELQVYDNMKFEFMDVEAVSPDDADIEYSDIRVSETEARGIYLVTFSEEQSGIEKSYLARPVLEGKDYEDALAVFETKQREYERLLKIRQDGELVAEANFEAEKAKFKEEKERIERINEIVRARNAKIEARNNEIREENKRLAEERAEKRALQQQMIREENRRLQEERAQKQELQSQFMWEFEEQNKEQQELREKNRRSQEMYNEVVRTFQIEQFGIWNCDRPMLFYSEKLIADFIDQNGNSLNVNSFTAVYKDINGIRTYYESTMDVPKYNETMIWTILNEKFAYVSYEEFEWARMSIRSGQHTFTLVIHPDPIHSRNDIRRLTGI